MLDLFKIRYPIIQAPMAGSDNAEFVAAASEAGILGSLGAQYRTPEQIKTLIRDIRNLTDKPFAVNVFALPQLEKPSDEQIDSSKKHLAQYYDRFQTQVPSNQSVVDLINSEDQLQAILDARVPVVSFTLGQLDKRWIDAFKANSAVVLGTATNVKEAIALEAAGVDAITAQSTEAGGHRGTFIGPVETSLIGGFALIPQIVDAVQVPVIAAGGIMDGRGIAAAIALGAKGVQMGTAFLTTSECPVHENYKRMIVTHEADDTVITRVFSGGAARSIRNVYIEENQEAPLLPFPFHNSLTRPFRAEANKTGDTDYTNLWSGQNGRLARPIGICELIHQLVSETNEVLIKLGASRI